MKIAYDPEKFGELKPGDDVQVMGVGIVSDDGISIEDQELDEEGDDKDDDKDDEESPKDETQEETDEEMAEGADLDAIIASGFGA